MESEENKLLSLKNNEKKTRKYITFHDSMSFFGNKKAAKVDGRTRYDFYLNLTYF